MSKTCENCEYYDVCLLSEEDGIDCCERWSGWHDLIENPNDLPEDGLYEIASADGEGKITIGVGQFEIVYGYGGCWTATMPTIGSVVAWRELPEYEVKDECR